MAGQVVEVQQGCQLRHHGGDGAGPVLLSRAQHHLRSGADPGFLVDDVT
jgi:hypothetical protein